MRIPRHHVHEKPAINITPLVDLMFNLIIFFLVSSQFHEEERDIQVNLPQTQIAETLSSSGRSLIIINVRRDGTYVVGADSVSPDVLRETMVKAVKVNPGQKVLVRADKQALHGYVAAAISLCKEAGISQANIGYELPH
jgi:biopolymer transport protein ExbD